jgi:hypothetical protein
MERLLRRLWLELFVYMVGYLLPSPRVGERGGGEGLFCASMPSPFGDFALEGL